MIPKIHPYYILLNLFASNYFLFSLAIYSGTLDSNPYLSKYDNLNYDPKGLIDRHSRVRRSLDNHLYLNFKSHGREFKLRLSPAKRHSFANQQIQINTSEKNINLDNLVNFYEGHLTDEPQGSYASGSIIDGVFYGTIKSNKNGKYFIEPSKKYTQSLKSHSIIYHEDDVNLNRTRLAKFKRSIDDRMEETGSCGSARGKVKETMKREQEALFNERVKQEGFDPYSYVESDHDEYSKYSKEANERYVSKNKTRLIREVAQPERVRFPGDRSICNLYLRVDPQLHAEIFNNEGNRDPDKTTTFILFYLNKHVEALNTIYNSLPFYDSAKEKYLIGLQFMIYRTKIITEEQCKLRTSLSNEELKLCEPYLDVSTFLNYVSLDNFTDYCLSYTFTARDFTDGTLGLAWVAKLAGSVGGVCERRQTLQGVAKSLNSGIVTVVNYQARVPEAVSQITFAHEVGHNFGSEHDPDDSNCSPGTNKGGNFIMYRRATTGTDKNNRNFSQCSREQMGPIIHSLVSGSKFCFKQYSGSLCGNGIVEEGEECDCGYGTDCKESCCIDASQEINKCKLRPGKECSPSQGPCCDNSCSFAAKNTICMHNNECLNSVFCSGKNATCPRNDPVFFKPDKTECNSGTQVCRSGVCSGSICEKFEMQQCFIQGNLKDKRQDKSILCHLACIGIKTENICTDSFEIPEMTKPNSSHGLVLKPGSPCVGTLGYCDIFSKCRAVDAEGPLARLKNLLLNPKTLSTIRTWIMTYWWAASLIVVGLLVFMAAFIKVCSVHTPSSNPRKPPALKITDTLRRPIKKIPHPHWPHYHHHSQPPSTSVNTEAQDASKHKTRQQAHLVNEKNSKNNRRRSSSANGNNNEVISSSHYKKPISAVKEVKRTRDPIISSKHTPKQSNEPIDKRTNINSKRHKSNEPLHYYNNKHPLHPVPNNSKKPTESKNRSKSVENSAQQAHAHRSDLEKRKAHHQEEKRGDRYDKRSNNKSQSPAKHHQRSEFINKAPLAQKDQKMSKTRKRSSTESTSIEG